MVLLNDWITLKLPPDNEAFLAKPPLSFWLVATMFKFFSTSEFTAKLPNFFEGLLTLLFTFLIARKFFEKRTAILSCVLLMSSLFFFIQAGTVDLDMMVCLTQTAALWCYLSIQQRLSSKTKIIYELVLGLIFGLCMLNRGPVSIVLFFGSLGIYSVLSLKFKHLLKVNWAVVSICAFLVSFPWYSAIGKVHPDFYHYFFFQEHILRYIKLDYGDRYGWGHKQPYGMAIIYFLGAFMPWTFLLFPPIYKFFRNTRLNDLKELLKKISPTYAFLLGGALFAPLFFSLARSILMTYIVGALPFVAIMSARELSKILYRERLQTKDENKPAEKLSFFDWIFSPYSGFIVCMLAVLFISAGSISYAAGKPYSMGRSTIMTSFIVFALFAAFMGYLLGKPKSQVVSILLSLSTVCIPVMFFVWFGCLSHSFEAKKSTKAFLNELPTQIKHLEDYPVYYWGDRVPYSWYFYTVESSLPENIKKPAVACYLMDTVNRKSDKPILVFTSEKYFKEMTKEHQALINTYKVFNRGETIVFMMPNILKNHVSQS